MHLGEAAPGVPQQGGLGLRANGRGGVVPRDEGRVEDAGAAAQDDPAGQHIGAGRTVVADGRCVTVDEGWPRSGLGAEIAATSIVVNRLAHAEPVKMLPLVSRSMRHPVGNWPSNMALVREIHHR